MSYQALARKWRPRSFATLVGQEHVVRALSHALATGRLHHAWLFTGTRGVGKTTISRILAKALNCESGVTPEPCGQCSACVAIDADRFPDYVEMDAASNRGVDDMAALLDQAVYAPVQGRYKVYMIDEVHMLTGHAFNAMLKTLEEPPEHVKFILATTDPQKIPVTVLSRCLQFNLKQMPPGHIVDHLGGILKAEQLVFDQQALRHIAKAASGSMRDALSLLDQAIAHGAGKIEAEQVAGMLGTVGEDHLFAVVDALGIGDVAALLAIADGMEARSLSFDAALQSLASLFHRIALAQYAAGAIQDPAERARLVSYAEAFDPEFLQLAYQIAIHGRDELSLAPDEYAGFTMTLLRLHAFRPEQAAPLNGQVSGGGRSGEWLPNTAGSAARTAAPPLRDTGSESGSDLCNEAVSALASESAVSAREQAVIHPAPEITPTDARAQTNEPAPDVPTSERVAPLNVGDIPPWEALPPEADETNSRQALETSDYEEPRAAHELQQQVRSTTSVVPATPAHAPVCDSLEAALAAGEWHAVPALLKLGGLVRELAQHCEWVSLSEGVLTLRLSRAHHHLIDLNPGLALRLGELLAAQSGRPLKLKVELGEIAGETPAQRNAAAKRARHDEALAALESDPFVRELIERFDATLIEASIKPL